MHVLLHVCIYVFAPVCVRVCLSPFVFLRVFICACGVLVCLFMSVRVLVYFLVCVDAFVHVYCVYVFIHVCIYAPVNTCMYMHIYYKRTTATPTTATTTCPEFPKLSPGL